MSTRTTILLRYLLAFGFGVTMYFLMLQTDKHPVCRSIFYAACALVFYDTSRGRR